MEWRQRLQVVTTSATSPCPSCHLSLQRGARTYARTHAHMHTYTHTHTHTHTCTRTHAHAGAHTLRAHSPLVDADERVGGPEPQREERVAEVVPVNDVRGAAEPAGEANAGEGGDGGGVLGVQRKRECSRQRKEIDSSLLCLLSTCEDLGFRITCPFLDLSSIILSYPQPRFVTHTERPKVGWKE